jgi:hypothetical protein
MLPSDTKDGAQILPKPIALTPDQLVNVAAGTVGMIALAPVALVTSPLRLPTLAGPFPVGPILEGFTAAV